MTNAGPFPITPLICVHTMQPNFYCVQDSTGTIERLSVYNLSIRMHEQQLCDESSVEFGDVIFDTHHGELDETGISPALFELQRVTIRTDNNPGIKVQCDIRKPIQIKLTPTSVENLLNFKDIMSHVFHIDEEPKAPMIERSIHHYNNIRELRKLIGGPNCIEFNMSKISVNCMTSMDRVVSLALFKWCNKIGVRERDKQITFTTNIESVSLNTQNAMLLNPTSVNFECILSQEKWSKRLVILTNFTSNILHLQINPNDFWTFAKVQLDFWSCINRHFNASNATPNAIEKTKCLNANQFEKEDMQMYELPKIKASSRANEEYFQDDLRFVPFNLSLFFKLNVYLSMSFVTFDVISVWAHSNISFPMERLHFPCRIRSICSIVVLICKFVGDILIPGRSILYRFSPFRSR